MNKKGGFTLVEVIFSIAFLSIVCVIMLQLLVTSYDLENETDMMDVANIMLINEVEDVKGMHGLDTDFTIVKYYDINWSELISEQAAVYTLELAIKRNDLYDRGLYDITGSVSNKTDELVRIVTKHYYNEKEW